MAEPDYELENARSVWRELPDDARQSIPAHLREGLDRYFTQRIIPGGFLQCVLAMELEAVLRCSEPATLLALPDLIRTLHTWAPANAWGSRMKLAVWVEGVSRG